MNDSPIPRINRREAIRWVLAVSGSAALIGHRALAAPAIAKPYGTDPVLNDSYAPGDFWPLTFNATQRQTVIALCDLIIPADDKSPAASALGVPDFIDEWVSAPYPIQQADRKVIMDGLKWLEEESARRFSVQFAKLNSGQQNQIAADICWEPKAASNFKSAAQFFTLFRWLVSSGFYTTPAGMKDVGFIGNVPLTAFPDAPQEVLDKLGLKG